MKYFFIIMAFVFYVQLINAQSHVYAVHRINLPEEISYYDNQFSGLQAANGRLYLMSESRLQDKREAKIYSIALADIEHYQQDTTFQLPYQKHTIIGLDKLARKMKQEGQVYEGLEAMIVKDSSICLSVETTTPSPLCYLLKGRLDKGNIYMADTLLAVKKPRRQDGSSIYNAGFEALQLIDSRIYAFYEYNYFDKGNFVYSYDTLLNPLSETNVLIDSLPFRITDVTPAGKNHFTAINYFYKGEGDDTVYRVPLTDSANDKLIKHSGIYHNYCRLIDIDYHDRKFTWKTLWEFPALYESYNWEGIAAYKNGYFIINDKYTPAKPYASVLLYVEKN